MNKNEFIGCFGTVLGYAIIIALCLFLEPALILKAWNMVAVAKFNAPALTYWEVFWASFAIQVLFKGSMTVNNNK